MGERILKIRLGADLSEFEKGMQKAAKVAAEFGRDLTKVGKDLTSLVTAPLVGIGAAAVAASEDLDDAMDRIRASTGATGDALDTLGGSFRSVFSEVPNAAGEVATAIGELSKRTGAAGGDLEGLATQMLQLAHVSGQEVGPLIKSTEDAFHNWGVATKDQSAELDFLWKTSQQTGVGVQALSEQVTQGGATLRALGLEFESGTALVGQFAKMGIDSGSMMAGLTKAATELAKKGGDIKSSFTEVVEQIRRTEDPSKRAALAIETFGKSGVAMADAFRRLDGPLDGFAAKIKSSTETIGKAAADTAGLGEAFAKLKHAAELALEPLGVAITKVLIDLMGYATSAVNALGNLTAAFGALPQGVQTAAVVFAGLAAAVGPAMIAVGATVSTLSSLATSALALKASAGPALAAVGEAFGLAATSAATAGATVAASTAATGTAAAGLGATVATAGRSMLAFATGPAGIATAALVTLALNWDTVSGAVTEAASEIGESLGDSWKKTKDATSRLWGETASVVKDVGADMLNSAKEIGTSLVGAAKSSAAPYVGQVKDTLVEAQTFAESAWDKMRLGAMGASVALKSSMQEMLDGVADYANRIADAMKRARGPVDEWESASLGGGAGGDGFLGDGQDSSGRWAGSSSWQAEEFTGSISGGLMPGGGAGPSSSSSWWDLAGGWTGGNVEVLRGGQGGGSSSSGVEVMRGGTGGGSAFGVTVDRGAGRGPATAPAASTGGGGGFSLTAWQNAQNDALWNLPRMAAGGIVTQPTRAIIGEAGPEAVIPLGRMGEMGGRKVELHQHFHIAGAVLAKKDLAVMLRDEQARIGQRNGTVF